MIPVIASMIVIMAAIIIPLLFVVFLIIKKGSATKFTLNLSSPSVASGDYVEGSVALATGKELPAENLTVTLVGVYQENRRKPRSTTGYDEDEDEWETTSTEVFRHDEVLEIPMPVPKKFKGELPFSFPAPRGEQVSVRTPSGGIRQGADIPEGDLPGAGFASLNWSLTATLVGADVEPEVRVLAVTLA